MFFVTQIAPNLVRVSTIDPRAHLVDNVEHASFVAQGSAEQIAEHLKTGSDVHIGALDAEKGVYCRGAELPGNMFYAHMPHTLPEPQRHLERIFSSPAVILC